MFLDVGLIKKLNFLPFCEQRYSTATQPGASFCAFLISTARGSRLASYFVHQRRHFLHKMLFTLRFWHTSPRRNHCCGLNPLCFTIDLKKPIAFSQPILRIGFNNIHFGANRADRPRCSKLLFFQRILIKNRWFSDPDRSRPLAPTGSGAQNRYFLKGF